MNAIRDDAQRLKLLFQFGAVDAEEIIAWADSWIEKLVSPPVALLDLSMAPPGQTGDILSSLNSLSEGAEFWTAFRRALPQIRDDVAAHPDRAEAIANHMYLTFCSFFSDVPDDLRFLDRFDDQFAIYGSTNAVCQEFIQAMDDWIADQPRSGDRK